MFPARPGKGMEIKNLFLPWRSNRVRRLIREKTLRRIAASNGQEKRTPAPISTQLIASFIAGQYGLDVTEPPIVINGGRESSVWSIKTTGGDWIVKACDPRQGPFRKVQEEVKLYGYLNEQGFHAPVVLPTREGSSVARLLINEQVHTLILMRLERLRRCRPTSIGAEELIKIAQTVARMHAALREYHVRDRLFDATSPEPVNGAYAKLSASPNSDAFDSAELASLEALDQRMVRYVLDSQSKDQLTGSVLHGDLHLEHAQFLPDGEVYLFDFGDRTRGPVAHELAVTLGYLYSAEDVSFERWEELKRWLLSGYTSVQELTPADLNALRPLIIHRLLKEIAFLSDEATALGAEVDSQGIRRRYELAGYLLKSAESGAPL